MLNSLDIHNCNVYVMNKLFDQRLDFFAFAHFSSTQNIQIFTVKQITGCFSIFTLSHPKGGNRFCILESSVKIFRAWNSEISNPNRS